MELALLRCLFFPRTGSLLLSSLSERVRGLQAGTQRGIREKPLGPQSNPSNSLPAASTGPFPLNSPSSCHRPPHPLRLLSPVTSGSTENPRPWGGRRGTPQTLGKGQRPPPPTHPQCVKTQQVAVAWRKVAFVALRAPAQLLKGNQCEEAGGRGGEKTARRAVPGAHSLLPSPLQPMDRSSGASLTLILAGQPWPAEVEVKPLLASP